MAKLTPEVAAQVQAGFDASAPQNPHIWSSTMWEAWEFGHYMRMSGREIGGVEKGRGSVWRTPSGACFRLNYPKAKGGGAFGFERVQ